MQDLVELRNFYRTHKEKADLGRLVLCTLVRKSGSSYRDIGAKKMVSFDGKSSGLLSGGCLEASIEKMARERVKEMPFIESFSTLAEEDRLLGYQTGCQGTIDILFEDMQNWDLDLMLPFGSPVRSPGVDVTLSGPNLGHREFAKSQGTDEQSLFEKWIEPVHLVIIGCGADADAYLPLAKTLGWSIRFIDYRRDLAFPERYPQEKIERIPLEKIAAHVPEGKRIAVVLMTHNYEADLEILRGLKDHQIGYLGCLGPAVRFQRLKEDLLKLHQEKVSPSLETVVKAPAGLFSHSRSPSEIALSVVAQIQGQLVENPSSHHTWTLILAAGASSRFGGPKALATWQGKSLLARAQSIAKSVCSERVMIVTGGHAEALKPHLQNTQTVFNSRWQQGMGSSIAAGVAAIRQQDVRAESILILPVDQPLVSAEHLQALARESLISQRCALTSDGQGVIGAPAALPKILFDRSRELQGDRGMKSILQKDEMIWLLNPEALKDVDHPEDLFSLAKEYECSGDVFGAAGDATD